MVRLVKGILEERCMLQSKQDLILSDAELLMLSGFQINFGGAEFW